ncbi:uncharacterized protein C2orf81 homolog isoform X2 [Gigantopelta aegis]|uniref:uncharacterized protein C2orf81 homolog isoform X2 n=1 Tax=Gigantopelta aegis TaxID=1735272 RepID=UPI001B88E5F7|nr:uncharacterized protein C2orf81 homolog isoform X2 [Gigantopelta aegis]
MSRATVTKSRADKGKPPAAQTPVISHEIVPGKFNDHDWNLMLDHDNSEEFIIDMLDTVVENTMNIIYENYIEKQLLPFTITQAKDAILQIVEWQFLARDDGEPEAISDPGWLQDEEPDPAITDCWAQGAVPKSYIALSTQTIQEEPQAEEEAVAEQKISDEEITTGEEEEPELPDTVSDTMEELVPPEPEPPEEVPAKPEQVVEKKKKFKFKPYRGKMKSAGVRRMSESLEESEMKLYMEAIEDAMRSSVGNSSDRLKMPASCQSLLKVQAGRPPGNKEVDYDDMGNVVSCVKLCPEKLPNHRVKVKYQVIDPSVEAAKVRLEAMRHGKYISSSTLQLLGSKSKKRSESSDAASTARSTKVTKAFQQPTITSLPPPMIEAMDIAPGVIVKEGNRMKKGPGRHVHRVDMLDEHQNKLRPVGSKIQTSTIDVADLLDRHTPILRPLQETSPLPPIVPHPPRQSRVS